MSLSIKKSMAKCTVCNGTGFLTNALKSKVTIRKGEVAHVERALENMLEIDPDRTRKYLRLIDRLHKTPKT